MAKTQSKHFCARRESPRNDSGNAILLSLVAATLTSAIALAQFGIYQANLGAAVDYMTRSDLQNYAESVVDLAVYDVKLNVSGDEGDMGTVGWTAADDVGADGTPATGDLGEGDGIPTAGEPNTAPIAIGPPSLGAAFLSYVEDTAFPNVLRVVVTVSNPRASATVITSLQRQVVQIPQTGAIYITPNTALDLKGSSFAVNGNDTNPDGSAGPAASLPGITTSTTGTVGDATATLTNQIDSGHHHQIDGLGGSPSIDETTDVDADDLFGQLDALVNNPIPPGNQGGADLGDYDANRLLITKVDGDLSLSGSGSGAGVLLVDGDLKISGEYTFYGLVIVTGDFDATGGGEGVHVFGSTIVGSSSSSSTVTIAGDVNLVYSSTVMAQVESMLLNNNAKYETVYYESR